MGISNSIKAVIYFRGYNVSPMTRAAEEKFEKIIAGNYRKHGDPIDIDRFVKAAKKINKLEEESRKDDVILAKTS